VEVASYPTPEFLAYTVQVMQMALHSRSLSSKYGKETPVLILEANSTSIKRVCRSTLAAGVEADQGITSSRGNASWRIFANS